MASGSKVLSDASGTYTAFDVGKLAVVNGAGAPVNEAAKLSATLSTGAPVTTLVVSALAAAFPSGPLTIEQEGHTQQFFCEGAAAGATALPVTSQTPSFAFTAAATIKSWGAPLFSKIASVQSATEVTLETAAGSTLTSTFPGEVVYGTDNAVALQAAITAAAGKSLVITSGPGEGFMHSETLKVPVSTTITGYGVHMLGGPVVGTSHNAGNFPQAAPYLQGSVLIPAAAGIDGIQLTGSGITVNQDSFGIRFAGKFLNTGHGFRVLPPITTSTFRDNGLFGSAWKRLKVFAHDGNHYAYLWQNSISNTEDSCQSYGGGGQMQLQNTTSGIQYGNHSDFKCVYEVICGGTAHGMFKENTAGSTAIFNMFRHYSAQPHFDQAAPKITGTILPTATQWMHPTPVGKVDKVVWVGGEGNGGAVSQTMSFELPGAECGHGSVMGFGGAVTNWGNTQNGTPTTVYHQLAGTMLLYVSIWELLVSPVTAAKVVVNRSEVEAMTSPSVYAEESMPAGSVGASFALSGEINVAGGARTTLPVSAIPAALPSGSYVTVVAGANSQQWKLTAEAAAGATSLAVSSQTPNATYASASSVYPAVRRTISTFMRPGDFYQAVATNAKFVSRQAIGVPGS